MSNIRETANNIHLSFRRYFIFTSIAPVAAASNKFDESPNNKNPLLGSNLEHYTLRNLVDDTTKCNFTYFSCLF